jgi:Fe-S cluster assembly protein SufD
MREQLQKDFDNIIKNLNLSQKDIEIKKFSLDSFINRGFPSRKEEDWRFSDLNQIIKKNIGELSFYNDYSSTNKVDTSVFVDGLEHNKIVFVNGRIEKIDFNYEIKDQIEIIDQSENINKFNNNNSLSDLNNAFTNKFFKIVIKKGYQLLKPLIIYHTTNSKIWSKNINLRLDFELQEDSSLRLIDLFNDTSEKNFLNIFYNFELSENSILKNYKVDKVENKNVKYSYNNIDQNKNTISETFILSFRIKFL